MYMGIQPSSVKCPRGKYRPPGAGIRWSECVKCPRGVYGDNPGLTSSDCTAKCPEGTYNDRPGGKSILDCSPCSPGTYGSSPGLTTRARSGPCPHDKYSLREGLQSVSECEDCPPNYRGPNGRRGNDPYHGMEGGYPCDRYIDSKMILAGRDDNIMAVREAYLASDCQPRNQVNNNQFPT
ncbi:hypothetical protein FI667_g4130, partial [Globisporangium splendens]